MITGPFVIVSLFCFKYNLLNSKVVKLYLKQNSETMTKRTDRGPAEAAPRPGAEPRRGGQWLHGLRAGCPHAGHRGPRERGRGRRERADHRAAGPGREHADRRPPLALRGCRELPDAQGERERPEPAGAAHHDGEPDQLLPAALQRDRQRVQHDDPDVPERPAGRAEGLCQARLLRGRARGPGRSRGQPSLSGGHQGAPMAGTFYSQIAANRCNSFFLMLILVVILSVLGFAIGYGTTGQAGAGLGWLGIFGVIAIISSVVSYFSGDKVVLGVSKARPVTAEQQPQLINVVTEMALAAAIPMPAVYLIDDTAPNAFATGRDPKHASIAITTGEQK